MYVISVVYTELQYFLVVIKLSLSCMQGYICEQSLEAFRVCTESAQHNPSHLPQ